MGRAHRQRGALGVPHRQAHPRLEEDQDRPRAGVRRRRVDRLAHGRSPLRRAAAGLLRRRRTEVRRPHGQRLQPARARARHSTAEAAGSCGAAVHDAAPDQRAAALDETLAGGPAEVHRMDRRWAASPSYLSRHEGRCESGDGQERDGRVRGVGRVEESRASTKT